MCSDRVVARDGPVLVSALVDVGLVGLLIFILDLGQIKSSSMPESQLDRNQSIMSFCNQLTFAKNREDSHDPDVSRPAE